MATFGDLAIDNPLPPGSPLKKVLEALTGGTRPQMTLDLDSAMKLLPPSRPIAAPGPATGMPIPAAPTSPVPTPATPQAASIWPPNLRTHKARVQEEQRNLQEAESYNYPTLDWVQRRFFTDYPAEYAKERAVKAEQEGATLGLKALVNALSGRGGEVARLPGAGTPLPSPNLPKAPDMEAARAALEAAQPGAPILPTNQEKWQGVLGGAAAGAMGAKNWADVLLGAGAGAAQARSQLTKEERVLQDRQNEREREHQLRVAQFEVDDAKFRHTTEWQTAVLQWQMAVKNAELAKPQIQATHGGLLVTSTEGNDRVVKFMPWSGVTAADSVAEGTKASSPTPGSGWISAGQTYMNMYPDKTLGAAAFVASLARKGGYLGLPGNMAGSDLKDVNVKGNMELGLTDEQAKKLWVQTENILRAQGVMVGSESHAKAWGPTFDIVLAQTLLQNPQMFNRMATKVFGVNAGK